MAGYIAIPFVFEMPCLMINTRAQIINVIEWYADPFGKQGFVGTTSPNLPKPVH
jgi:hypothetical protein